MTHPPPSPDRRASVAWLVALAVATCVVIQPVIPGFWRQFIGRTWVDAWGTQWFFWLGERQVLSGEGFLKTDLLFHPWGKDVYLHTGGNLLDAWLALPFRLLLGPVAGYNLWIALLVFTNGLAGAWLARRFGGGRAARGVAALLLATSPFVLQEIQFGRPTQAFLLFPVLCLGTLFGLRSALEAVLGGVLLALAAWSYWYYGLVCALLATAAGTWRMVLQPGIGPANPGERSFRTRVRVGAWYALAAGVALALTLPGALPLLHSLEQGQVPGLLAMDAAAEGGGFRLVTEQGDTQGLSLLLLSGRVGSLVADEALTLVPGPRLVGWVYVALLGAGLVVLRRGRFLVAAWTLLLSIVAAGPVFIAGSRFLPNPVYAILLEASDVIRRWWWPVRSVFAIQALAAALGGLALERIRLRPLRIGLLVVAIVSVAVGSFRDGVLPLGTWSAREDPEIACLAAAPPGAVLDLPHARDQEHLYLQTLHGHPVLAGMLARKSAFAPEEVRALVSGNSFVRYLVAAGDRRAGELAAPSEADRRAFVDLGYRYVLVHLETYLRPSSLRGGAWASDWPVVERSLYPLLGPPAREGAAFALYTVDGTPLGCP